MTRRKDEAKGAALAALLLFGVAAVDVLAILSLKEAA